METFNVHLNKLRGAIQKIDEQLIELIVQRLRLVGEVGTLKREFELPIEEYLFALSFGLMWSPLYEYMRDVR